jgi:hypothetical protein
MTALWWFLAGAGTGIVLTAGLPALFLWLVMPD